MSHLDNYNAPQARSLASNDMYITFKGRAAHASGNPEDGINAFNAAQLFVHASDMLRQHLEPGLQFHGIITRGGEAPNIVPERVELDYYLRSPRMDGLAGLREKLARCVEGAAIAVGCQYEIAQRWPTYADLFSSDAVERSIVDIYKALGLPWHIYDRPDSSSDVGNVDMITPTLSLYAKCSDSFVSFHSKELVPLLYGERGRKTLIDGTNVMASFLLRCGLEPDLIPAIREDWERYRGRDA
jgi:metal-dependent amidase/aminoacylase/carboxypeptidase family protein